MPNTFTVKPRKSNNIKLFLLATAAVVTVGALIVANQEDEVLEPPKEFASAMDCVAQTNDAVMCEQAFKTAKDNYLASTQPFSKLEECEAQFGAGKCATGNDPTTPVNPDAPQQQTGSGSNFFVPMMAGVLLSRVLSGGGGFMSSPFFRNAQGDTFMGRCDNNRCDKTSSNFAGTNSGGRTAYSGGFVNSWMSGRSSSSSSSSGFHATRSGSISRGGFGGGFHASGG